MPSNLIVSPSLLSADPTKFGEEVLLVRELGAKWLHFDIMDGHFVPNISFGPFVVKALSNYGLYNDVHLMVTDPLKYAPRFIEAGANLITFHYEAVNQIIPTCQKILEMTKRKIDLGLSIKPRTQIENILPFVNFFNTILIMSVEPGFSGQSFIPSSLEKIKTLRKYIDDNHLSTLIEVDGGVNDTNVLDVKNAGADVIVSGSYLFKARNKKEAMDLLLK